MASAATGPATWQASDQARRQERLALGRNALWTFAGNAAYALCQWAVVLVLARCGGADGVGEFVLGWSLTAPVFLLAQLQLRALLLTDARDEFGWADYLGLRLLAVGAAVLATFGLAAWHGAAAGVILLAGAAKSFEAVSDLAHGWWQRAEQSERMGVSQFARGLLMLGGAAAGMLLWQSAAAAAAGVALAMAAVLAAYDLPRLRSGGVRLRPAFVRPRLGRLLRLAFPLGLCMMLLSLQTNLPRLAVERHGGTGALGLFAAMAYLVTAGSALVNAVGAAASPRLALAVTRGDRAAFHRVLRLFSALALAGGAGAVALAAFGGTRLLGLLYGPGYAGEGAAFVWIVLAGAISFQTSVRGFAATALRRLDQQPLATAGAVGLTGAGCLVLMPRFGLAGAGMAMTLAALFNLVVWWRLARWSDAV